MRDNNRSSQKKHRSIFVALALAGCGLYEAPSRSYTDSRKIALVTDSAGKVAENGFNRGAYDGAIQASKDFDLAFDYIETKSATEYEKNIKFFIDNGVSLIITVGFFMAEVTFKMAAAYPNVKFAIVDVPSSVDNVAGIVFTEDQGGYLAGVLAGKMTTSKKVGVVGGVPFPSVQKFVNGYINGVGSACSDCTISCTYVQSFAAPEVGAQTAASMVQSGVDVVFGAAGGTGSGAILEAAKLGAWVVGVDVDEYGTTFKDGAEASSTRIVSSALKRVDNSVYTVIKDWAEGKFKGGANSQTFSALENGIDYADFHDTSTSVPYETKQLVKTTLQSLAKDANKVTKINADGTNQLSPGVTCASVTP